MKKWLYTTGLLIFAWLMFINSLLLEMTLHMNGIFAAGSLLAILLTSFSNRSIHTILLGLTSFLLLQLLYAVPTLGTAWNSSEVPDFLPAAQEPILQKNWVTHLFFSLCLVLALLVVLVRQKESIKTDKILNELESLFEYSTIGMVITNQRGAIVDANQCAEQQFGYTRNEMKGNTIEMLLPDRYRSKHQHYRKEFHQAPSPRTMGAGRDLHAKKKDGTEFPVEISLSHFNSSGETFVIAYVVDISVRKQNEAIVLAQKTALEETTEEIKRMNLDLEQRVEGRTKMLKETLHELEKSRAELSEALEKEKELSDLKSRFVTMASHEFRTPLSTILSSTYLIEQYQSPDELQDKRNKHLQRIRTAVGGMKAILEDFLSIGKLEEGAVQTNLTRIPLTTFENTCLTCIQNLQTHYHQYQISFYPFPAPEKMNWTVSTDLNLVQNIINNLLSNAAKFSPKNPTVHFRLDIVNKRNNPPIHPTVSVGNENLKDRKCLVISIQDHGIGIAEEEMYRLYDRFFRAKNASNIQGTGLGLHIVSRYVELLNGFLVCSSKLEEGTLFELYLEISPVEISDLAE
jgi:PAS domain S-box-containing protein